MAFKRVAVLRGGPSEEYDVSMQTGQNVLRALEALGYPYIDIVITKRGEWLDRGMVRDPEKLLEAIDVVFLALHGTFGEDGQIQRMLHRKHIPFTGSGAVASGVALNKALTKKLLEQSGILLPRHRTIQSGSSHDLVTLSSELYRDLGTQLIVKPNASGSSHGVRHVLSESQLQDTLNELLREYDEVLVEEYVLGREATVGVLQNFRNTDVYTLPVVEIIPPRSTTHFSYEAKYSGQTEELCPGRFSYAEKTALAHAAQLAHTTLGCDQYSRSDFIVRNGNVYFLEINTLPGLTSESLFPKAAAAVGLEFNQLIQHLVETARV